MSGSQMSVGDKTSCSTPSYRAGSHFK